ncbi:hypothetical protein ABPG75_005663 [Micractinium tetrahymenae]
MGKNQQPAKGKAAKGKAAPRGSAEDGGSAAQARQQRKEKKQQRRRTQTHHYGRDDLERELAPLGLRIKTIEADGNCFFRSVADQLEGDGGDHLALRCRIVDFIRNREEDYRFFIEDDEPFDSYVRRMSRDGAWAGHLELQAASVLLQRNFSVYQAGQPVWHIRNFPEDAPTLHLSYHQGMHYNSVRNADDYGAGPPAPLRVRSAAQLAAADPAALAAAQRSFGEREVDQVMAGTGCADRARAARALEQCGGSVDQAIELLIEQLGQEEEGEEHAGDAAHAGAPAGQAAAAAAQPAAAAGQEPRGPQQAQQAASHAGEQRGAAAASTEEQQAARTSQQHVAGPAAGGEQRQEAAAQQQGQWCRIRLELALDPDDPAGRARVALFPAPPQQAQQMQQAQQAQQMQQAQQELGIRHAQVAQQTAAAAAAQEDPGAAEAAEDIAGSTQSSSKERPGKKGARIKARVVSHPGRNKPCPCGSKVKYKDCCARRERKKAGGDKGDVGVADGMAAAAAQLKVLLI